jgi:hypothetical protein
MKKLKLQLDELQVESFHTARAEAPRGTVQGNQPTRLCTGYGCTDYVDCTIDFGCAPDTQDASCEGTCGNTCYDTCLVSCNGTCDGACFTVGYSCYDTNCCGSIADSACGGMACP